MKLPYAKDKPIICILEANSGAISDHVYLAAKKNLPLDQQQQIQSMFQMRKQNRDQERGVIKTHANTNSYFEFLNSLLTSETINFAANLVTHNPYMNAMQKEALLQKLFTQMNNLEDNGNTINGKRDGTENDDMLISAGMGFYFSNEFHSPSRRNYQRLTLGE